MDYKFKDTQDGYYPKVGIVGQAETVYCGVCGKLMNCRRNQRGYREHSLGNVGWQDADYADDQYACDVFECHHINEAWHQKVIALREWRDNCPVDSLREVAASEADRLVKDHEPKKDASNYDAFHEGYNACRNGAGDTCPMYVPGGKEASWHEGWRFYNERQ